MMMMMRTITRMRTVLPLLLSDSAIFIWFSTELINVSTVVLSGSLISAFVYVDDDTVVSTVDDDTVVSTVDDDSIVATVDDDTGIVVDDCTVTFICAVSTLPAPLDLHNMYSSNSHLNFNSFEYEKDNT